ncbi:MAG: hypothetical protein JRF35_10550 [Deltaproteobacteria bacterium]|nr:hypothetical protein [Deltaproteobacteria bacterium]
MWEVLKTAQHVSGVSSHVRIRKEAVASFSKRLHEGGIEVPPWSRTYHFCAGGRETVSYLLVLDSLNFCFWPASGESRWEIIWGSRRLSGYFALAGSLARAMNSGVPLIRAEYLARLSVEALREILGGRGELQLMEDRVRILNELGHILLERYNGEASGFVEAAAGSAEKLVGLLVKTLTSFRDVAEYLGQRVYFYKRAQIFCADLYGAFEVDWALWNLGQQEKFTSRPHHRTVTIFY